MSLTVTFEISDQELDQFRSVLESARTRAAQSGPREIVEAARAVVERLQPATLSPFVAKRLQKVRALIGMLDDPEWQLPEPERQRVLDGLAYVADAHDLVPDDVPVLGLVDDAIMLELVLRELQHEIDAYEDFDGFRSDEMAKPRAAAHPAVSRKDWLESKRRALHGRIRERRERDLGDYGGAFQLITHL